MRLCGEKDKLEAGQVKKMEQVRHNIALFSAMIWSSLYCKKCSCIG